MAKFDALLFYLSGNGEENHGKLLGILSLELRLEGC